MASTAYIARIVHIGDVPLGGTYPVRIQSMTSTNTMDTPATVAQAVRMIEAGCEYIRITAPGVKEAENLSAIKKELRSMGYNTPLIADIHYQPQAALIAARHVEKVRINPGNYIDRKRGKIHYTEAEYNAETEKIRDRMKPLTEICRQHGTAIRIGINHGSLAERILLRYGDTPAGMVESALEFVRICQDLDFQNLVLSMKSSNVKVMVQANRLLVKRMLELGMDYPIHLGVTEAGDGEDGRIKSAAGIGPLLADGIGDTIRVSLTEDPELEIPVARSIVEAVKTDAGSGKLLLSGFYGFDPFRYNRRNEKSWTPSAAPLVVAGPLPTGDQSPPFKTEFVPDLVAGNDERLLTGFATPAEQTNAFVPVIIRTGDDLASMIPHLSPRDVLVFNPEDGTNVTVTRQWFDIVKQNNIPNPVILHRDYPGLQPDTLLISATIELASLLVDGLPDGIWIKAGNVPQQRITELAFGILQATGERISKTEYIACPSCGRTLFNIQSTLREIRQRTSHLKGLKIGVMGCCVNGPGEMADAHYGYVGAGKGKITLYKGRQIMKTGIREEYAVDELIRLIKENGDWK